MLTKGSGVFDITFGLLKELIVGCGVLGRGLDPFKSYPVGVLVIFVTVGVLLGAESSEEASRV